MPSLFRIEHRPLLSEDGGHQWNAQEAREQNPSDRPDGLRVRKEMYINLSFIKLIVWECEKKCTSTFLTLYWWSESAKRNLLQFFLHYIDSLRVREEVPRNKFQFHSTFNDYADMIFVQNFLPPDFQAKYFTPEKCLGCDIFSRINRVNASYINNSGIFWGY